MIPFLLNSGLTQSEEEGERLSQDMGPTLERTGGPKMLTHPLCTDHD